MIEEKFTFIDLYCGAGFGARGLVDAGGAPLLAIDAWPLAARTYKDNFPGAPVICTRVEDLDPIAVAKKYQPNLLMASPECTSHSVARGGKPGCESSRRTALHILPWIRALEPRWVIIENVSRMRLWKRHPELITGLRDLGFGPGHLTEVLLNAVDFGAPQSRERLFLIGDRHALAPLPSRIVAAPGCVRRSASSILDAPGTWLTSPVYKPGRAQATLDRAARARSAIGRDQSYLMVYYGSDGAGGWQTLDAPLRTVTTLDRFALVERVGNVDRMRMLQPTELTKAMLGLDQQHQIKFGNRRQRVKLCGNGICAPVTSAIAAALTRANSLESHSRLELNPSPTQRANRAACLA
ncbi:DNA cytosine methyltransferase [Candidatus Thiodictyon syntrophicum]|jgi:DNA (cytosine-5)-methyltransferase 1|uniref:DNA (cytosine-5-)-methyltransferase n=1 Tax=Candidatus Thiodictyon syntrophicum TaxID=1166950 RepID=A0A2K8UGB3_9GAMM|nr:hypothetical protein THSYN_28650 [Candidatus Thiodictyon syntrophicum]